MAGRHQNAQFHAQESTHTSPTRGPLPEPRKAPLALIPTNGDREKERFALRVLIRYLSPSPGCPRPESRPRCREHWVGVRERTPSPSGRPPRAPGRLGERILARVRALPACTLPRRCHCTSPPSPALPPVASSHHQAG